MKSVMIAASAAAALLAFGATGAQAETTWYANLGYSDLSSSVSGADINLGAIQGRVGAQFTPHLGVEGEAAFGVKDENFGGGVSLKLKHEVGVYAVVKAPVSENFDLFARVGYASAELELSGGGGSISGDDSGAAFGAGAQYFFDANNGVRGEYTRYDFGGDADVWSISYVRKF